MKTKRNENELTAMLRRWRYRAEEYEHGTHWTYKQEKYREQRRNWATTLHSCALELESELRRMNRAARKEKAQ